MNTINFLCRFIFWFLQNQKHITFLSSYADCTSSCLRSTLRTKTIFWMTRNEYSMKLYGIIILKSSTTKTDQKDERNTTYQMPYPLYTIHYLVLPYDTLYCTVYVTYHCITCNFNKVLYVVNTQVIYNTCVWYSTV